MARRAERGIALPLVLWTVVLLAGLIGAFQRQVSEEVATAASNREAATLRLAADGGVELGLAWLRSGQLRPGDRYRCRLADTTLTVAIEDEAGKIDLNVAPPELMAALFVVVGVESEAAQGVAAAIVDYRDPNRQALHGGMEPDAGLGTYAGWLLKNRPLDAVEEVVRVTGMTPDLLGRIRSAVTVHSGLPGLDPAVAAPLAHAALRALEGSPQLTFMPVIGVASPASTFTIRSHAITGGSRSFSREAIVRVDGSGRPSFEMLRWRRAEAPPDAAAPNVAALPPCEAKLSEHR